MRVVRPVRAVRVGDEDKANRYRDTDRLRQPTGSVKELLRSIFQLIYGIFVI